MKKQVCFVTIALCLLGSVAYGSEEAVVAGSNMPHRMMLLAIQLGLILFAAKMGNILFKRIKLPGMLGELAAGMLIGPYCLGGFGFSGFGQGLFPRLGEYAISPELYGFSAVAAIVLLFVVGLETDFRVLLRYSLAGGLAGLGGIVLALVLGAGVVAFFSELLFDKALGFTSMTSIFMGVICTATSVGITARIISERGKLNSPEGATILSAAIIDDVAGIILLAIVLGVVAASKATGQLDWGHVGMIGLKAVSIWLSATVVGLIASRKISFLLKCFRERTSIAIMALGMALMLAGFFEEAGLAMIIGAYVMGLSLSRTDISHVIREKLQPVYSLFVPIFFCVMGMQIDFGVLADWRVLAFGLCYGLAALAAKVLGCGLPAMLANFNVRGAALIGLGMAPRCEVALIIASIGLSTDLINQPLFAAVVIMIVVNTVLASLGMGLLLRSDAPGTRKAVGSLDKARKKVLFDFPSLEFTDFIVDKLSGVFESEGFYVHLLGLEPKLYQLRKDMAVIDLQCSATELTFECDEEDVALVNTAVYESVAALEQALDELKKPLDTDSFTSRIQDQAHVRIGEFNLRQYITPDLMTPKLKGNTKAEVIDELLEILDRNGLLKDVEEARQAVWRRENGMSTGLKHGMAIPHGKTDAVDRLVCAVGIKREGIDYGTMDGQPANIIIITLSPSKSPAPHVQFLSVVSQFLSAEGRERIMACRTSQELFATFVARPKRS